MKNPRPWLIALVIWPVWTSVVVGGEWLQAGTTVAGLDALVSSGIVIALIIAPLFLLAVVASLNWWSAVGFTAVKPASSLRLLWLPGIYLAPMLLWGAFSGGPIGPVLGFIVINTALVGLSEELMFRGLLMHGARTRFSVWTAVIITALMFGIVHALNGLLTGDFQGAFAQALQATLFGVWIAALRLRLGSLWPVIVIHVLWDLSVFMIATGPVQQAAEVVEQAPSLVTFLVPVAIELPLFLYGLWLLRGFRAQPPEQP